MMSFGRALWWFRLNSVEKRRKKTVDGDERVRCMGIIMIITIGETFYQRQILIQKL